ncbi:MAG: hypothetical protein AUI64_01705, partial [Acidobacteria bacterium 13_1_40CM_2_64_6]
QTRPIGPAQDIGADEFGTADTTPPTVSLTAPASGATVSGTGVMVSANASDNVGVAGVQFKVDGGNLRSEDVSSPYSRVWNSTTVSNGSHTLTAVARDAAGNTTTSAAVTVTVNNTDTTPPSASITAPAGGTTVSASVTVSAATSDNIGVAGVQFLLDGVALGAEDTSSPYSIAWNTTTASNGVHALTARARDAAGNQTTSAPVSVTVSNSTGNPPAIDAVASGDQGGASSTVTTSAFSTTAGNELLLAFISGDGVTTTTVNGVSGAGLTWQLVRRTNVQLGTAEIWRAFASSTLTNVSVTATMSAPVAASITVVSFGGVDTSGTNGSGAIGATASANANPGAPSATLTTTRNNAWVFGVGNDWDTPTPRTLGPNQTMVHQYMPPVGDTYWVQRMTNPTAAAGTSVTINDTAPAGDRYNLTICEILSPIPADTTPPTVSMTAPASGATVSTSVTVSANASDNLGVAGVQFTLDGANLGAEDTTSPYSFAWDTTTTSNGSHSLTAVARDAAGNTTTSTPVTVTVNNTTPDTTPPTVSITAPANGATVSASITVSANAADDVGVAGVQFKVDGVNLGAEDTTSPYSFAWNTTTASNGSHALTAVARDAAGNTTTSATVTVTVNNGATVVNVSTEPQLQSAIQQLASDTTIVLAPGTYVLTNTLAINGTFTNITITGGTNNSNDVVVQGRGMNNASYGTVPNGVSTAGSVQNITISNLTIRDVYLYSILFDVGTQSPRVSNVHLIDAGQQFLRSTADPSGKGADNGIVEDSTIEYTATSRDANTNGVDIIGGANWIVRRNTFRNIVGPAGVLAGPAVLAVNGSSNTLTERNTFLNCARGIAYGIWDPPGMFDHTGGIIRNNFFYRSSTQPGDVGIGVTDSPNTQVLNNTVIVSGTYPSAIEYRFAGTTGVVITNNLLDGSISARDAATGTVSNNLTTATASMFVNASAGDLHLVSSATAAIDHGVTLTNVTSDVDGQSRPSGAAYDMGADEYVGDTTPPTVSLTAPANGATVSGTATVSATASDDVGVAGVQFKLDGVNLGSEDTSSPYSATWNSTTASNGSHTLTAVARDAAGNTTTSTAVTVTVSNIDATPPTVSVTGPANGSTVSATVSVTATASDNVSVAGVQFTLDGANLGTEDTASPYSTTWDTTTASNGSHTLTAVARDAAGNTTTSAPVTVIVSNTAPDTTPPTVSMTAPASGATVSSSVTVSATASDNVGVVGVQFLLDGTAVGAEDTSSPYSIAWNTATASNGVHTLAARARDATGNSTTSSPVTVTVSNTGGTPSTQPLLQQSSLTYLGSFRVPAGTLGSTYGFNAAGTGGLGTYAMTFNPARNSLFLGGHPYEQRVAELAIPSSLTGTPTATALQNLIDPLEGRLSSINPSDPNSKVIGSALVYNNQLFIGAFSYYDGAATQTKSEFVRPVNLSTTGQVVGPVKIGANYPGWVDKYASLIPAEWQASFGGPALAGGTLGAINSLQSWGPSATVFDPANVTTMSNVPGTLVLGYPYGHPLADTAIGNQYLSQADFITGMVFPTGTRSVLFFGKHGLGNYCYGTGGASGGDCYDPDDNSKGIHSYPYRSQIWAYDANDLIAVKNGQKQSYDVVPYAVWQLDAAFVDIQGVAYDSAAQRLYVSRVYADNTRPLINVYQVVVP